MQLTLLRVLVAAVLLTGTAAARADVRPMILGGLPVSGDGPAVALRDPTGRLSCSGVLVAPRAVLTAAHCFPSGVDPSDVVHDVCFGASARSCAPVGVRGHAVHPGWDELSFTFDHDLAVVFLEEDAPVAPAGLASSEDAALGPGDDVLVVGFGRTEATTSASSGERRAVRLAVQALEDGRLVHGEGACRGDSGGPVIDARRGDRVVAITSSGPPGCADFGRATLVAPERGFIDGAVRESEPFGSDGGCRAAPVGREPRPVAFVFAGALAALLGLRRRSAPAAHVTRR